MKQGRTRYVADVYDFGRDYCGNPTAHYRVIDTRNDGRVIVESKSRREQTGYDGTHANAAVYALEKKTGKRFRPRVIDGDRTMGRVRVELRQI